MMQLLIIVIVFLIMWLFLINHNDSFKFDKYCCPTSRYMDMGCKQSVDISKWYKRRNPWFWGNTCDRKDFPRHFYVKHQDEIIF